MTATGRIVYPPVPVSFRLPATEVKPLQQRAETRVAWRRGIHKAAPRQRTDALVYTAYGNTQSACENGALIDLFA